MNLNSCKFNNNNYDLTENTFQGGFIDVSTNNLIVASSNFTQGFSLKGVGVSITPSQSKAVYSFEGCLFQNLLALQEGSAVHIGVALNSTSLTFKKCIFDNIAAERGGGLFVTYPIQSKSKQLFYSIYPIIEFQDCTSSNVYAQQGGLIYSVNTKINMDKQISTTNNPNKNTNLNSYLLNFIKDLDEIGEYIYLSQSFLTITTLNANDHSSFDNVKESFNDVSNVVFLSAFSKSSITITGSQIDNSKFSTSGFIKVDSSSLKMISTNLTNIQSVQSSSRLLSSNINFEMTSKVSAITISNQSVIDIYKLLMKNVKCTSNNCSGGALLLINSGGVIESSNFEQNTCFSNGGSISIINGSTQLIISNTYVVGSSSLQGNGGAISLLTDQNTNNLLKIENSFILNNSAQQGGGIFFEFQKQPNGSQPICSILNTSVSNNEANVLGGGIYYQGFEPFVDSASIISQNSAKSPYGQNSFSYPKTLLLNQKLSQQESSFSYNTYINSKGQTVYKIYNQVSGIALPNLIFQLVDENGSVLDKSYSKISSESVTLEIEKETELSQHQFSISSSVSEFSFSDYFNITNLIVTGTPGTTVFLQIHSDSIKATSNVNYRLILEIDLRSCERGEIFQQYTESSLSNTVFYKCFKCQQGTYSIVYPDLKDPVLECKKCNQNAFCPGGDVLEVSEGYWRINDQTDNIIECINAPQNCLGGPTNSTCSEAHTGPLCESCDIENEYSNTGSFQCGSCGDQVTNTMKIIGLMILSAKVSVDGVLERLLTMLKIKTVVDKSVLEKTEQDTSILLKLILNYFQVIMVLTTFQISIPTSFNAPVDVIASPTTQILYSFECFFYQISLETGINMIYIQIISSVILPIVCLTIFYVSGSVQYRKDPFRKSFYLNTSFLYCFMYFQPSIFKNAINIISCRSIDMIVLSFFVSLIGDSSYIQYNVLFECYTSEYNLWSYALILPIILVIGLIIPVIIAFIISQSFKANNNVLNRKKYIFMTGEYRHSFWYWEFIKIYMKLLIMCCLIFYEYDVPNKILFIFFIVAFYGFLLFKFEPYNTKVYEKVDILQTAIQGISIYLAFVAYQNINNVFWWLLALVIIAVLNFIFIVWCVNLLTKAYIISKQSKIEELKLYFIKFLCCRKYFFNQSSRKLYIKKRWLRSVIQDMKKRKLINLWTGKLKVEKEQVFHILEGKVQVDEKELVKMRPKNQTQIQNGLPNQSTLRQKQNTNQMEIELFSQRDGECIGQELIDHEKQKKVSLLKIDDIQIDSPVILNKKQSPKDGNKSKSTPKQIIVIDSPEQNIESSNFIDIISSPASPNMTQAFIQRDKSSSNNFVNENENNMSMSSKQIEECIDARPDQRYLQEYSPQIIKLNNNKKLIPGKKEEGFTSLFSQIQNSSPQNLQKN